MVSFDNIKGPENDLNTYKSSIKKARTVGKPAICREWLHKLRVYVECKYNQVWNDLMLTDRNSALDCCLEILGDTLFSRFFTKNTGELVCTPERVLFAYKALVRFYKAQENVHNEIATNYDEYLLTDIAMAMPDEDALEKLTAVYAYTVWLDLFYDDAVRSIATQVEHAVTWADVDIPTYLIRIFANYFAGSKHMQDICLYDPRKYLVEDLCAVLRDCSGATVLHKCNVVRDLFYTGVDMQGIPLATWAAIENTALYYNGHLRQVMARFSNLDVITLLHEVKRLQEERAGAYINSIQTQKNDVRIFYGAGGITAYTIGDTPNLPIKQYTPEQVFMLTKTTCPLFNP